MELNLLDLTKEFSDIKAVDHISINLRPGIIGLLGENGAGKTTLIRMMTSLMKPSTGNILFNGQDIYKLNEEYRNVLGYLPQDFGYYPDLNPLDYLGYIASIKAIQPSIAKRRIKDLLQAVSLWEVRKKKIKKFSGGMIQRLGIAQAILHEPNLLILDEPTNGLDPEGIKEMRELLVDLATKEKMAILISSHNLAELDNFCTKVCIIKNGEVIETSEISEIKKETSQDLQLFEVNDVNLVKNIIKDITVMDNHRFKINVSKEKVPEMIEKLVENKIKIYEVKQEEKTLEDAFFEKTGGNVIE